MISVDWKIALGLAQQRYQGGGLLVSQITPENGVKGLRDRPKPVEERFAVRREVHQLDSVQPTRRHLGVPGHKVGDTPARSLTG
jgi:hypothetical protein